MLSQAETYARTCRAKRTAESPNYVRKKFNQGYLPEAYSKLCQISNIWKSFEYASDKYPWIYTFNS